ncbi:MAG: PilZ domain-containing protein [Acidobacteriia bacterium]|nr:PilZ domain-containing protein [Terriglobia bacterium]
MTEDAGASYRRTLMVGGTDQRCARRFYVGMSASLKVPNEIQPNPAFIRDCSWAGIFLYSAWVPALASDVEIALESPQVRILCTGRVVRVEPATAGAVTGVAVSLERCEVVRQPNQPILETPSPPG